MSWLTVNTVMETNLVVTLLSRLCKFKLLGVPNSLCKPTGMLIIDEGVALVVSNQKLLQPKSAPLTPNTRIRPAFL